jgi:hypothetical protein
MEGPIVRRAVLLALVLASLAGCRAYNSNNPYPSDRPKQPSEKFPITKEIINNNVEHGSPNL